jgi:type IV pilus assembly protein PilC
MKLEYGILIVAGAVTAGLVAFAAFLILLGRRAGQFGVAAAVFAILYPILAVFLLSDIGALLWPDPIIGLTPDWRDIVLAMIGRLVPLLLFLMLPLGWLVYAHRRYRETRQEEVALVLATAVEAGLPLAPAVRAYLNDRPREGRAGWDAALLLLCPPGYLVWTQRRTFDDRVAKLSQILAAGAPLPLALRTFDGVAAREVAVAAEVGEATGRLAECLRQASRHRLTGVWLEALPRIIYPFLLLIFVGIVAWFLSIKGIPSKYARIMAETKEPVPIPTARLFDVIDDIDNYMEGVGFAVLAVVGLATVVAASPTVRWCLPVIGRPLRWESRGTVLRMLGALFEADRPAPEALGLLAAAPDLPAVVRRRLGRAQRAVGRGELLPEALRKAGLLSAAMAPLVTAAGRTRSLPSALTELGEMLSVSAGRAIRRASLVLAPILIVAVGLLVGYMALGIFLPLIRVLTKVSE